MDLLGVFYNNLTNILVTSTRLIPVVCQFGYPFVTNLRNTERQEPIECKRRKLGRSVWEEQEFRGHVPSTERTEQWVSSISTKQTEQWVSSISTEQTEQWVSSVSTKQTEQQVSRVSNPRV
jgi:hypothetical protein